MAAATILKNSALNSKPTATTTSAIHQQNRLTTSLERILEEASLSGELKLSGRKLKDFPRTGSGFELGDTVIADLSRNRFTELPEDVTTFAFLETLLIYHNALRSIPETVQSLRSLTYLDLRSNQLSVLPREICFLPIQILLVSNNRLTTLPEELGRMSELTELDVSCNQISHMPARLVDLKNLKSLSLRNNQLVYLPIDITNLPLVTLDISCNRIASLPVELRLMTTLVDLELDNNPLTSPPASLCVRGLVHVFKYLDTVAQKDERSRVGGSDGHATLRRTATPKHMAAVASLAPTNVIDLKMKRQNTDSGYSSTGTVDDTKRWDTVAQQRIADTTKLSKSSPSTPLHVRTVTFSSSGSTTPIASVSPANTLDKPITTNGGGCSNDISPDSDDKQKIGGNAMTYKEYKEALRQQRYQESSSVYRPRGANDTPSDSSSNESPVNNTTPKLPIVTTTPSPTNQSTGGSVSHPKLNGHATGTQVNGNGTEPIPNSTVPVTKKPVQKVTPSRNSSTNGDAKPINIVKDSYVKPNSPTKSTNSMSMSYNNVPAGGPQTNGKDCNGAGNRTTPPNGKATRSVSWNRDVPADKLSFTMRREFDRQKEETELIERLRKIIETRLKMSLPPDIEPALTDGVVLCHLANHVRPRSVGSVHVPSPAAPKLPMARCRRNVDNFLEACRKIGVDENLICSPADVLEGKSAVQVAITVSELLRYQTHNVKSPTKIPLTMSVNRSNSMSATTVTTIQTQSIILTSSSTLPLS